MLFSPLHLWFPKPGEEFTLFPVSFYFIHWAFGWGMEDEAHQNLGNLFHYACYHKSFFRSQPHTALLLLSRWGYKAVLYRVGYQIRGPWGPGSGWTKKPKPCSGHIGGGFVWA